MDFPSGPAPPTPPPTQSWISEDLTAAVPLSWMLPVTERSKKKGLFADMWAEDQISGPPEGPLLPQVQCPWAAHHLLAQRCLELSQVTQPLLPSVLCAPTGLGTRLSDFQAGEEHPDPGAPQASDPPWRWSGCGREQLRG